MKNEYKICIYFFNKEKPLIITDVSSKESPYIDTIKQFEKILERRNNITTLEFAHDIITFNDKDVESVKISKPELNEADLVVSTDAPSNAKPLGLSIKSEDGKVEDDEGDEVFEDDSTDIQVVE